MLFSIKFFQLSASTIVTYGSLFGFFSLIAAVIFKLLLYKMTFGEFIIIKKNSDTTIFKNQNNNINIISIIVYISNN